MNKLLLFLFILFVFKISAQEQSIGYSDYRVKISKDSTDLELKREIDSLTKHAFNQYYIRNYNKSLQYGELANEINKKLKNINVFFRLNSMNGNTYIQLNDTIKAREILETSIEVAKAQNNSKMIAAMSTDLGNLYAQQEKFDKAIKTFEKNIPLAEKLNDTVLLFVLHFNIQEIYLEKNNDREAAYHIKKAENYLNFLPQRKAFRAGFEVSKGRLLFLQEKNDEAIETLKKAIALSKEISFMDGIMNGYSFYIDALAKTKDFDLIYLVNKELDVYKDQQFNTLKDEAVKVATAQIRLREYEKELKATELQNELSQQEAKRNELFLITLSILSAILVVYLLSLLYYYQKRKKYVKELTNKNKQYLDAKENSEALSRANTRFFSTVSHELRTPLYGVIGLSTILLDDPSLKSHEKDLKSLKFSADYLLALINDVLQISKIESNNLDTSESSFHVKDFLQSIVTTFEYMRLQNKNVIKVKVDPTLPKFLKGNVVRLSQILMNLVGNACKFTENGTITITLESVSIELGNDDDKAIKFIIADTGIGIAKNEQNSIFDEFTQVASLDYSYQGTGLGLPIVRKLLKASNSEIILESKLGEGTRFTFQLIFKNADGFAVLPSNAVIDATMFKGKKILIAEDNRINQIVTKKILEKKGVLCTIAKNGKEAHDAMKKQNFDLILMDLNMPIMDGFEATLKIRKFNSKVPIIALTAVEVEEVRNKIYAVGMDDIIVKPYDDNKFTQIILVNLSNPRSPRSNKQAS